MNFTVEQHGFTLLRGALEHQNVERILAALGPVAGAGRRGLLAHPEVSALACSQHLLCHVRPHLPMEPVPVRALYFDKSPDANWLVPWHQDLTLAVREHAKAHGFGPWSTKEGVPHVQPPVQLLEQMLAVRLHLDDADADNGALRVLPGSHRAGRLSPVRIQELRASQPEQLCVAAAGDALLMRPLLLHASSRSASTRHRRVLHLEYAAFALPPGLHWHEAS
ncbi:MAG: phytanoyl-CoA dioxygenase family protein [Verrucomicrobia bacterium]|nr:phytanoyl-CoA dioxygenase family protein [Verrucomicrobiota bacterium]